MFSMASMFQSLMVMMVSPTPRPAFAAGLNMDTLTTEEDVFNLE